jgi:hypothetical protein
VNTTKALNRGLMRSLIKVKRSEIEDFSLLERGKNINRISRKKQSGGLGYKSRLKIFQF